MVDAANFIKYKNVSVAYFSPSYDGKKLAFGIAKEGVEIATIYILDVDSKKLYNEKIFPGWDGINSWTKNNNGFLYTLQQSGINEANPFPLFCSDTRLFKKDTHSGIPVFVAVCNYCIIFPMQMV